MELAYGRGCKLWDEEDCKRAREVRNRLGPVSYGKTATWVELLREKGHVTYCGTGRSYGTKPSWLLRETTPPTLHEKRV